MRTLPRFDSDFADTRLNQVLTDIIQNFGNVLDYSVYAVETTWTPPLEMDVPIGRVPRTSTPSLVRCDRATDPSDPVTPVIFGSTQWRWVGNGKIVIDSVDGLVPAAKYRLTFSVVG